MNTSLELVAGWLMDFFLLTSVLLAVSLGLRLIVHGPAARVSLAWGTWLGIAAIAVLTAVPMWPRVAIEEMAAKFTRPPIAEVRSQPEANLPLIELPIDMALAAAPIETTIVATESLPTISSQEPIARVEWTVVASATWLASVAIGFAWILLGHYRTRRLLTTAKTGPAWVRDEFKIISGCETEELKQKSTKARKPAPSVASVRPSRSSVRNNRFAIGPGLWSSDRIATAVAMGARSPQIVLPEASVAEDNRPAIRAALAHEWAHIRHGDLWLLALERALLPLLVMHPLFWWLRRSVRLDQELLADAAAAGEEPVVYAEALLAWARSANAKPTSLARHGLAAVGMWENPSTLSRRVAMLVDSKRPLARPLGRGWTIILAIAITALVLGLSLVSLRPLTAQEDAAPPASPDTIVEDVPRELTRPHREAPGRVPPTRHTMPVTQIHMNVLIMSVDREQLDTADTTLEDEIAAATESRCRKEAGLVVSDIQPEEVVKLLEALKKHAAVDIVSRPQVVTLDGREAMVHVGGEAPLLRVEETINGKHEERIEYKEFGTILMLRPKLEANEKEEFVRLDIVAEQSSLIPPGEKAAEGAVPRDVPGLVSHKFKLTSNVKLGGSLLVAESPPNKKHLRDAVKQQFLLIVTPQRAVREAAAVYADPREGDKGEAARKATEAALEAATAAEPELGTAAAVLLKRERQSLAAERSYLEMKVASLESQVELLKAKLGPTITLAFSTKHKRPSVLEGELNEVLLTVAPQDRLHVKVESGMKQLYVQCPSDLAADIGKVLGILDRPLGFVDDPGAASRAILNAVIERRSRTKAAKPPAELKDDVQYFPPGPEQRPVQAETRAFRLREGTAAENKAKFDELLAKSPPPVQKVAATFRDDWVEVIAPPELMDEVRKLLKTLGAEEIARTALSANPAAAPKVTKVFRLRHTEAIPVIQKIGQMIKKEAAGDVTLVPDGDSNAVIVSAPETYFAEIQQVIQMLDKPATDPAAEQPRQAASRVDVNRKLLELELAAAKLEVEKAEKDFARIQKVDVSQAEADAARIALATAQIQVQKAAARLEGGAPAADPAADSDRAQVSRVTEMKLLELDLAEAKLTLQAAEADLARIQQLRDQNVIPEEEVSRKQLAAERAKIQVQRIMVKLEGAQEGEETRKR